MLSLFTLTSCGRRENLDPSRNGSRAPDGAGASDRELVRRTFADRVPSIDAALPLASRVDTLLGTTEEGLWFTGWFAGSLPARIDVEQIVPGDIAGFTRYYYDEDGALFASSGRS